jgi:hypothetical protein
MLGARLIGAQEEERKRLARELHDDLNQQIAAMSIAMGNLKRHIPEERADARAQSDRIHQKLVNLAESVRHMSHELHPAILQYSGLAPALQSYCKEFGALTGVQVSLTSNGEFDGVPSGTALCIYRIAQRGAAECREARERGYSRRRDPPLRRAVEPHCFGYRRRHGIGVPNSEGRAGSGQYQRAHTAGWRQRRNRKQAKARNNHHGSHPGLITGGAVFRPRGSGGRPIILESRSGETWPPNPKKLT